MIDHAPPMEWGRHLSVTKVQAIFAVALALRLLAAVPFSAYHGDEIWEYLEPAHGLLTGHSVVTWDIREGIRSALLPVLVAGPMFVAGLLGVRLFLAGLSMLAVWAAYRMGAAISRTHGLTAAFVIATWSEIIYMAPRALTEPVSAWCFLGGAALLLTRRSELLAGILLGLAVVVRIQSLPAAIVLVLLGANWRRYPKIVLGAAIAVAIDPLANFGEPPLHWALNNFVQNAIKGKAATFGTSGTFTYLVELGQHWNIYAVPIFMLAVWGGRRYPALLAAAVTHLVVHSLIGHKEWRFDFLFVAIVIMLAGIGTASLIRGRSALVSVAAGMVWLMASAVVAITAGLPADFVHFRAQKEALQDAGDVPPSCGVAAYRSASPLGGAYVLMGRDRTLYVLTDPASLAAASSALGSVVTSQRFAAELPSQFRLSHCHDVEGGNFCVFKRSGPCSGSPPAQNEINQWLERKGL